MMKRTSFYGTFTLLVICLSLGLGCAPAGPDRPDTFSVTGTVTHNGEAVEGAAVTFAPDGTGHAASGTTDASGKYTLTTFKADDGAVAGQYGVKIIKTEGGADAGGDAGFEPVEPGGAPALDDQGAEGAEDAGPKQLLPEKYADPSTSGFTAAVVEGSNTFDFALED